MRWTAISSEEAKCYKNKWKHLNVGVEPQKQIKYRKAIFSRILKYLGIYQR